MHRRGSLPLARFVVLALVVSACSSDTEKVREHLSNADTYAQEGKTKEAMIELRNALKLEPKSAETNYRIAKVMQQQGNYGDALFYLRETQRLDPANVEAPLDEAKLLQSDDPTRATELVVGVIQRDPTNPLAHLRRMEIALQQGNTQEALAAAMTALELAPNDPLYHMQLGIVHHARAREIRVSGKQPPDELWQSAVAAYRKSDELYGGNPFVRIYLGKLYLSWGDHVAEARDAFRGAIEIANKNGKLTERQSAASAGLDYARIANDAEFGDFALQQLLEADDSNLDGWAQLASLRQTKDGTGKAVWQSLLERRPDDLDAHWRFASWLFQNGQSDDALAHLSDTAAKSGKARSLEMLSAMQLQLGKNDEARATIERLEKEFPGDPSTQLASARRAVLEIRYADAAPALRDLSGKRENAEVLRLLAVSELNLGNLPAALAAIDRSLALSRDGNPESMLLKARIHHASRDWPLAIQTYTQVSNSGVALTPRDLVLLAGALYAANRPLGGRQILAALLDQPEAPPLAALEWAVREGANSPERTEKYVAAALEKAPRHPGLLNAMTRIDLQAGREDQALARLDKLIETGDVPPAALLARARILAGRKQFEAAERDVNRVFEAAPNLPGGLELLLQIYAAQNKLDQAVASFEEADRAGALSPGARLLLGRLYLSRGENAKARTMLERALAERADLAAAKNDLAFLLASEGVELDRALTLAQEAQQALATDPQTADTLGYVYYRKSLYEPALEQARYAVQLADEAGQPQAVFQYHMGLALRALGRNEEATAAFERALAIDPNFSDAPNARKELEAARAGSQAGPSSS